MGGVNLKEGENDGEHRLLCGLVRNGQQHKGAKVQNRRPTVKCAALGQQSIVVVVGSS